MGKIRNKRHAYHTAAPKLEDNEAAKNLQVLSSEETSNTSNLDLPFPKVSNNIFGNVFIAPDMLKQQLVTVAPTRKEKKRAREALKRKEYGSIQVEFKEMLLANKRLKKKDRQPVNSVFKVSSMSVEKKNELKKRVGVTHMESLMDALPSAKRVKNERKEDHPLSVNYKPQSSDQGTSPSSIKKKRRTAKPSKTQAKEMSEDMNTFHNIMKNSTFTSDPFATISSHIKMKLEAERQNTK